MEYLRPLPAANDNLPRGDRAGGTAGFLDAAEAFAGRALFPGAVPDGTARKEVWNDGGERS